MKTHTKQNFVWFGFSLFLLSLLTQSIHICKREINNMESELKCTVICKQEKNSEDPKQTRLPNRPEGLHVAHTEDSLILAHQLFF